MKIRYALAGLLAAVAMTGVAPSAVAATPTAAGPANVYSETAPSSVRSEAMAAATESCNNTRVCFYNTDGHIVNLDPYTAVPICTSPPYVVVWTYTGFYQARNLSGLHLNAYLYQSDGTWAPISRLDPGETIAYTPSARYGFCVA